MKALWLVVIVGLILIVGVYILSQTRDRAKPTSENTETTQQNNSATPPTTTDGQQGEQKVVIYTDAGFTPSFVTVRRGTTVIFKNDSSQSLWVGSDPHPQHTGLPGFDSRRGIAQGGTYSFTFEKEGTWGYHNHLKPSDGGEITVQ